MADPNKPAPAVRDTSRIDGYMQAILMGIVQQKGAKLSLGAVIDMKELAVRAMAAVDTESK